MSLLAKIPIPATRFSMLFSRKYCFSAFFDWLALDQFNAGKIKCDLINQVFSIHLGRESNITYGVLAVVNCCVYFLITNLFITN